MVFKNRTLALIKKTFIKCLKGTEANHVNVAVVQRKNQVGSLHKVHGGDASL